MKKRTEIVVGIVILLSAVLVVAGTLWLKGGGLAREELVLEARLREVGQLQTGNTVKLRGVPIGRVAGIRLETEGDGVIVTLNVQRDAPIPADPVVIAAPVSMFVAHTDAPGTAPPPASTTMPVIWPVPTWAWAAPALNRNAAAAAHRACRRTGHIGFRLRASGGVWLQTSHERQRPRFGSRLLRTVDQP